MKRSGVAGRCRTPAGGLAAYIEKERKDSWKYGGAYRLGRETAPMEQVADQGKQQAGEKWQARGRRQTR